MPIHHTLSYDTPATSILGLIGGTPMVRIQRMCPNPKVTIMAKLEGFNPTGSIKDRIALKMIEQAEQEGTLTHDKIILEPTSGNTGIALAMIGAVKGYQVEIVMSEAVSVERRKMIAAFGAKVTLTAAKLGTDGAIMKARELVRDFPDKYFMPDQFSNHYNQLAHYLGTAQEILRQTDGSSTTSSRPSAPAARSWGWARAQGKAALGEDRQRPPRARPLHPGAQKPGRGHRSRHLRRRQDRPAHHDRKRRRLRSGAPDRAQEGIFAGMSSGAALFAARQVASEIDSGTIVTIFPDRGEKYLSTELFKVV
jgi:cysteine synthase B